MTTAGLRRVKVPLTLADSYVSVGWWMVMTEDEQGYAPAAYLEPLDGNTHDKDLHPQTSTNEGKSGLRLALCVAFHPMLTRISLYIDFSTRIPRLPHIGPQFECK